MRPRSLALLTLASALLYGASFPPAGLHALAWVAPVPLLVAVRNARSLRATLGLVYVWALAVALGVASWLPEAVATYYLQARVVGAGFFLGVASVLFAPAYLAFAAWYRRGSPAAAHIVWPESAMTFFVAQEPRYQQAIGRVLGGGSVELVAGGPRTAALPSSAIHNAAFLLSGAGQVVAWYDKEHLLPFGEYFPLGSVELLRRRFGHVREFVPGDPIPPLPTAAGRAGVLICNESMFPEIARARVRSDADYLLVLTNDAWLGSAQFARMHFDMAVWRAVEQRRYVVRASTAGPSAIVDPRGRVRAESAIGTDAVGAGAVVPRSDLTPYGQVGDLFAWGCVAVALAAAFHRRGVR
jgi:apolipoprotein N-acyltransferase